MNNLEIDEKRIENSKIKNYDFYDEDEYMLNMKLNKDFDDMCKKGEELVGCEIWFNNDGDWEYEGWI
ncbi:hypothetical protein CL616_04215 [archaeon]|jgi:hypothetical protein|nr:hypothetical protein [archaeon]MAG78542.1 hypothetical protein [archaeon]|tara:strand:+ start:2859 stop:3059 length:201 start_codon:yes stop_codon:yes gene_type:complete